MTDTAYEYRLEELENHRIPNASVEEPSHMVHFERADRTGGWGARRYYVDVDGDELTFVMENAGSSRKYEKNTMFPPRFRELLEADGWTVIDEAEHIDPATVDRVEDWLEEHGVDPENVVVTVSPRFRSVTFTPRGYLDSEKWERYIGLMRDTDVIQWAEKQQVHYVEDGDLPDLLDLRTDGGRSRGRLQGPREGPKKVRLGGNRLMLSPADRIRNSGDGPKKSASRQAKTVTDEGDSQPERTDRDE